MAPKDITPLEDQPLPADASPIAASPDSVAEEDPEEDQANYPIDGGDGNAGAARQPGPTESDLRRCRVEQAGYGLLTRLEMLVLVGESGER
nr:hypothetical protein [Tanacetum cinerariifolium]